MLRARPHMPRPSTDVELSLQQDDDDVDVIAHTPTGSYRIGWFDHDGFNHSWNLPESIGMRRDDKGRVGVCG